MKKKYLLLLFATILSAQFALAQRTITGNVTGEGKNDPLIGAAVLVKGKR